MPAGDVKPVGYFSTLKIDRRYCGQCGGHVSGDRCKRCGSFWVVTRRRAIDCRKLAPTTDYFRDQKKRQRQRDKAA